MSHEVSSSKRRARLLPWLVATVLAVVGVATLATAATQGEPPGDPSAAPSPRPSADSSSTNHGRTDRTGASTGTVRGQQQHRDGHRAEPGVAAMDPYPPVGVRIPSLGVDAPVRELGIDDTGAVEVPDNADDAGWFDESVPPGASGASVLVGHVTYNGAAVFLHLNQLTAGDRVQVRRSDGSTAVFAVQRLRIFPKSRFPTEAVYRPTERPTLRLITCGGKYDPVAHNYSDNVIVFADLVGRHG